MEKVKTGIGGLSEMLDGVAQNHRHVLTCGSPGIGKTMLCMEFLYGSVKVSEPGLFITLEELPARVMDNTEATFPKWSHFLFWLSDNKLHDFLSHSQCYSNTPRFISSAKLWLADYDSARLCNV